MIKLIAAVDSDWGISKDGKIPWSFPEDMKFFREKTIDSVAAMGRNTFFSIKDRPLKDRINCVVSKSLAPIDGAKVFRSLEEVVAQYDDFWIIGGAQLYNYALKNNLVDYALITQMRKSFDADKFIDSSYFEKFSKKIIFDCDDYFIAEYICR
jgi:dihydrofolate reductase